MFLAPIVTVKAVFAAIVSPFVGDWNLVEGIAAVDGIWPMGMGLQDPVVVCRPFVIGVLGRVRAQKLAKLLVDVAAAL
jgi:hypothetical protein